MTATIRPLQQEDIPAADDVLTAAFGYDRSVTRTLHQMLELQPGGWLAAELDGAMAGVVGAVDYGPFAYIGMMGVRPELRRRGIALALMTELLAWLDARGCPSALLDATVAGAPLYARLGFVEDEKTYAFVNDDCARLPHVPESVQPLDLDNLLAVAAFDAPLFGADRTRVLAQMLDAYTGRAFLVRDQDEQVAGYLIAQEQRIGPWMARTPADAEALFAAALTLAYDGSPRVLLSASNRDVSRLLLRYGFSPQRSLSHMRRGAPVAGDRSKLYGLASFALG